MRILQVFFLFSLFCLLTACSGTRPENLGITNGQLIDCPKSPNCVSTQTKSKQHQMSPISFNGTAADAMAKLKKIISNQERTEIIKETSDYLHVEYTTKLMRFVDDVEFYVDEANQKIHFRSASRLGHSDMGLNERRMTEVVELFGKE